jgi:tRNA(Ile)-lysidine synthase TilS/MesJ
MALAYLCSQTYKFEPWLRVADHPVHKFDAIVVDHKLRDGSADEVNAVKLALNRMRLRVQSVAVDWKSEVPPGVDYRSLPNVESLARSLRYRRLGSYCRFADMVSLFVAHHEDDQYETVLMRLLSGHGYRGLRGMRRAGDIPECYGMYGAHQSGFHDDKDRHTPFFRMGPTRDQKRRLRRHLSNEIDPLLLSQELRDGAVPSENPLFLDNDLKQTNKRTRSAITLAPLDIEDGGVTVYRPLLEFSKDRLVATCLENGIPWFEDHTNSDATYTMRNAVRSLYKNHNLPVALQKPAVLQLARNCNARAEAEEADDDKLLSRVITHDFNTSVGSMVVQLPDLAPPKGIRKSRYSEVRRRRKVAHYRLCASILVRKLLSLVSPEEHLTPISNLLMAVLRLFPSLSTDDDPAGYSPPSEPKSFVICGVHFIPLVDSHPLRWYLARAPYPSNSLQPLESLPRLGNFPRSGLAKLKFGTWTRWNLFDGRFWIRVRHKFPFRLELRPFGIDFAKSFREGFRDSKDREALAATLSRYAPGKVRYTLPALYARGDVQKYLRRSGGQPRTEDMIAMDSDGELRPWRSSTRGLYDVPDTMDEDFEDDPDAPYVKSGHDTAGLHVVALPTLGFQLPGLGHWAQWQVRYRKIDYDFLAKSMARAMPQRRERRRVQRHVALHRRTPPAHRYSPSRRTKKTLIKG